ncbi:MAG: hypothetical protein KDB21_17775, partial [Acidimicrobiales bacterium]|nr:hypothetical protein [Acidimicrobiales bacterium]
MTRASRTGAVALVLALLATVLALTASSASAQTSVARINVGGETYVDGSSNTWVPDTGFVFGEPGSTAPFTTTEAIAGTEDDPIYQSELFGENFGFAIPTSPGCHVLTLHFAETYWGAPGDGSAGGVGSRVFDVTAEGGLILDDYDIFAEVGALTAVTKTFNIIVGDNIFNLGFTNVVDKAKISGIEVETAPFSTCDDAPRTPSSYVPLTPSRLFDTRDTTIITGGSSREVQIAGVGTVPANATAVVLNVTALNAAANGFVTAFPTGTSRPLAASLNMSPGDVVPNFVTVAIGTNGSVSFFSNVDVHLVVDLAGYYVPAATATAGRLVPLTPTRLFDTRPGPIAAEDTFVFDVLAHAAVPDTGVSAVAITITAANTAGNGFVTAYPGDAGSVPLASQLTIRAGQNRTNLAIVPVGADGTIAFFVKAQTNLVVDITGYFTDGSAPSSSTGLFVALTPRRSFDTRSAPAPEGVIGADQEISVVIAGDKGIPADAIAVAQNNTAVGALGTGFVTAYPTGSTRTETATLVIFDASLTRGTAGLTPVGTG